MDQAQPEVVMRGLVQVWSDFSAKLDTIPFLEKLQREKFRPEDYQHWLLNHRQQVIEGGRWIARAASSISHEFAELRSTFLAHAVTEHRDYRMLEQDYLSVGGSLEHIQHGEKNIGAEALHAFMFHHASQPDPFHLLGAMFIIEGVGRRKAGDWGRAIQRQLVLKDDQMTFLLYHGEHDEEHMEQFDRVLRSGILTIEGLGQRIIKTAKITARLYRLQLEELGNV